MKKLISILLVLVLASGLMATAAFAADVDVTDAEAAKGESVTIEVKATGVSAFSSCLAALTYDKAVLELTALDAEGFALDGYNVNDVTKKEDMADYEGGPMVASNIDTGMIAYATGGSSAADGVLFTATFKVLDSAAVDKTTVTAVVSMWDADGKDVLKDVEASGDITVKTVDTTLGDVNGDKKVDGRDLVRLKRFLAGITGVEIVEANTEMINGKAGVNGQDVVRLTRYLAGISGVVLG